MSDLEEYEANFRIWIAALREPERKQTQDVLGRRGYNGDLHQCCLGVLSEVAGCAMEEGLGEDSLVLYDDAETTPPIRAMAFIGLSDLSDPTPDWGDLVDKHGYPYAGGPGNGLPLSAMGMNDRIKLTFSQIADVFEYFGVKR